MRSLAADEWGNTVSMRRALTYTRMQPRKPSAAGVREKSFRRTLT